MKSDKNLFFFAIVAAISLTISSAASLWIDQWDDNDDDKWIQNFIINFNFSHVYNEPCFTSECYQVANSILQSMDRSINPCDNFYRFTCGKWENSHPLDRNGKPQTEHDVYQSLVYRRIRDILKEDSDANDILPVRQAKKLYRSCTDKESRERRGLKPLLKIVKQAGGWPLAMNGNDWKYGDPSWQEVERHYARLTGHNAFYDVTSQSLGYSIPSITIVPSRLLEARIPWEYRAYFIPRIIAAYIRYNGANVALATFQSDVRKIMELQEELIQLYTTMKMVIPLRVAHFEDLNGRNIKGHGIDWKSGIQNSFDLLNITVHPKTHVWGLEYAQELTRLLEKTPLRTIVNYVHWNFISSMLIYTTEAMMQELNSVTKGTSEVPRWKECVDAVRHTMKYAVNYLFEKKYYPKSTQSAVSKMIKNIKIALENNIDNSNWLDDDSKTEAKELLGEVSVLSDNVKWYRNRTALTNFYEGFKVGAQYFENSYNFLRFQRKGELMSDWMFMSQLDEYQDPLEMNAMFIERMNNTHFERFLDISPAILQPPLFVPELPESVNYGHAGVTIGHELGHGFDYKEFRVSSNIIMKNYYQKARCFIDQFDNYFGVEKSSEDKETRESSRGFRTVSENIADSTGLQAVFQAYKNLKETKGSEERRLPGLESFTSDQMFFISYGARRCQRLSLQMERTFLNDTHTPEPFRLIGSVSNTDDFAKVFNCPIGSPMNPLDKCNIWKQADATLKNYESTD